MRLQYVFLLLLGVCIVFFYKTFIFGQIPFPGDLLINDNPYRTESFLGYAPGGYPNKAQGQDITHQLFPWKYFSIQQLKKGQIPFWNPHNFSGNIHMQNFQTGIFYPLNILFFILPFSVAWSLFIFSQPILASWFMYLFLRKISIQKFPSIIGAIAFAFSAYMTVWMEYGNIDATLLWLPPILYMILLIGERRSVIRFLLLIGTFVCAFLAGYIQGVFYIYIITCAFSVYYLFLHKAKIKWNAIIDLGVAFIMPVFLSAYQLLPTIKVFSISTRGAYSLDQIRNLLQPVYYGVTLFVPDFFGNPATRNFWLPITYIERVMYMGIPLLFFALYAVRGSSHPWKRFFLAICIICFLITTNFPGIAYIYRLPIPVIDTTVPTRLLSIFIFSSIVLGVIGFDTWIAEKKKSFLYPICFFSVYIGLWIFVFIGGHVWLQLSSNLSIARHNLVLSTLIAFCTVVLFIFSNKKKTLATWGIGILIVIELFYFFQKFTPFSPSQFIYPQTPVITYLQQHAGINRYWGYSSAYIAGNISTYDGTYSPEGNDPLHTYKYGQLLASSENGKVPTILPRPDANIANGFGPVDMRTNMYRQKILDLLGITYVLNLTNSTVADTDTFPSYRYQFVWQQGQWQVYKNLEALPRFFLTSDYQIVSSNNEISALYKLSDLHTLLLSSQPTISLLPHQTGKVALITYQPNEIIFQTHASQNTLLFLSDTYYDQWKATVDTKNTPIYLADVAFRAIPVPAGNHTVRLFFSVQDFTVGLWVAGIGCIITLVYAIYLKKQTS